jgi:hypothetical protein
MKKNVSETIISTLQGGPVLTKDVVMRVSVITKTTPQAVYKTLSLLRKKNHIIISNGITSLSLLYIEQEQEQWNFTKFLYTSNAIISKKLSQDKAKITYTFSTLKELDLFWTHTYTILAEKTSDAFIRYMLIPHDFFFYALPVTDNFWVRKNINPVKTSRLVVPYALPLDKKVVRVRKDEARINFEFSLSSNPLNQKEHEYINILGDFIFFAKIDQDIHKDIVSFISSHVDVPKNEKDLSLIRALMTKKGRFTLTIERNKLKAKTMEKKLQKYLE